MDRTDPDDCTMLGATQKAWLENVIANITTSKVLFCVPGYVQGAGNPMLLKQSDFWDGSVSGESNFEPERVAIFKTALDANPYIRHVYIVSGDHHFCSTDTSIEPAISSKIKVQVGTGAIMANRQDVDNLNDSDYDFLSDLGAGATNTVRGATRLTINASGSFNVSHWRMADPSGTTNEYGAELESEVSRSVSIGRENPFQSRIRSDP